MPGRLPQAISTASQALLLLARSPRHAAELARATGRQLLDRQFEQRSPLALLPDRLAEAMGREPVTLPPRRLFAAGNQDAGGLVHLVSIARAISARTIFEIGTYNGLTALTVALNAEDAVVHTLDLEPGQSPKLPLFEHDPVHIGHGDASRVYEGTPESVRIVQHFGDSALFDFAPYEAAIDLVYVDGAHSFEYVSSDSEAAFSMVSKQGAIMWDDYWRQVPGVASYLHSLANRTLYRLPGSRLVVWFTPETEERLRVSGD